MDSADEYYEVAAYPWVIRSGLTKWHCSEPHCHSVKESGTPEAGGVDPGSLKLAFISSIFRPRRGQLQV